MSDRAKANYFPCCRSNQNQSKSKWTIHDEITLNYMWKGLAAILIMSLVPPTCLSIFVNGGIQDSNAIKILSLIFALIAWLCIVAASINFDTIRNKIFLTIVLCTIAAEAMMIWISFFLVSGLSKDVELVSSKGLISILVEGIAVLAFYASAILLGSILKRPRR